MSNRGVSSVTGIVILVVLTVVLSAAVLFTAMAIVDDQPDQMVGGVVNDRISPYEDRVNLVERGNARNITVVSPLGTKYNLSQVGDSAPYLLIEKGAHGVEDPQLRGVKNGERQVLRTTEIQNGFEADITVDKYGTGMYTSIQDALNNSQSGDIVVVEKATYNENVDVPPGVFLIAEHGTVLQDKHPAEPVVTVKGDDTSVMNFIIDADPIPGDGHYASHGIKVNAQADSGVQIVGNKVWNASSPLLNSAGLHIESTSGVLAKYNDFNGNDFSVSLAEGNMSLQMCGNQFDRGPSGTFSKDTYKIFVMRNYWESGIPASVINNLLGDSENVTARGGSENGLQFEKMFDGGDEDFLADKPFPGTKLDTSVGCDSFPYSSEITKRPGDGNLSVFLGDGFTTTVGTPIHLDAVAVGGDTPYNYSWTLGDGSTYSSQKVTHSYASTGTYTVTVEVTDAQGNTSSDSITIEVVAGGQPPGGNSVPTADFSYAPNSPELGTSVSFDGSGSTDADGDALSYAWDFNNDGAIDATGQTISNIFNEYGSHPVTLIVTDEHGATDTHTQTLNVLRPLTADFTYSPTNPAVGATVSFNGTKTHGTFDGSLTYTWNFGDSSASVGATPSHTYDSAGNYSVTLTTTDASGQTDSVTKVVSVTVNGTTDNTAPTANFEVNPESPEVGGVVTFDGSLSTDAENDSLTYRWDFGADGTIDNTGKIIDKTYSSTGTYKVALTVTDEHGATDSFVKTIDVSSSTSGNDAPSPSFTYSPSSPDAGGTVTFDASGSTDPNGDNLTYTWDFNSDGTLDGSGEMATHTFPSGGTYTVELTAIDEHGASSTVSQTVDVSTLSGSNSAPTADYTYTPSSPVVGENVDFDGSISSDPDGDALSYTWDFNNDGTWDATGVSVTHAFSSLGTQHVKVLVTDEHGATDTETKTIDITTSAGNNAPTADFAYTPSDPVTNESITFDASLSSDPDGDALTYQWDLDNDGDWDATGVSVTHAYAYAQDYDVTLRVTDTNGAPDSTTKTLTISTTETSSISTGPFEISGLTAKVGWNTRNQGSVDADGNLYFANYNNSKEQNTGYIYKVSSDGTLQWQSPLIEAADYFAAGTAAWKISVQYHDGYVYFNSQQSSGKLDASTGDIVWRREFSNAWTSSRPLVDENGNMYRKYNANDTVLKLDGSDGSTIWATTLGARQHDPSTPELEPYEPAPGHSQGSAGALSPDGNTLYWGSRGGLAAINVNTGDLRWKEKGPSALMGGPITVAEDGTIYTVHAGWTKEENQDASTYAGPLIAWNPDGSQKWSTSNTNAPDEFTPLATLTDTTAEAGNPAPVMTKNGNIVVTQPAWDDFSSSFRPGVVVIDNETGDYITDIRGPWNTTSGAFIDSNNTIHFMAGHQYNGELKYIRLDSGDTLSSINSTIIANESTWGTDVARAYTPVVMDGRLVTFLGYGDGLYTLNSGLQSLHTQNQGPPMYTGKARQGDYVPIQANFTTNVSYALVNEPIAFNASETQALSGSSLTYEWDFNNDGTTDATGEEVTHTYSSTGNYSVSLTASSGQGSDTVTKTVQVSQMGTTSLYGISLSTAPGQTEFAINSSESLVNGKPDGGNDYKLFKLDNNMDSVTSYPIDVSSYSFQARAQGYFFQGEDGYWYITLRNESDNNNPVTGQFKFTGSKFVATGEVWDRGSGPWYQRRHDNTIWTSTGSGMKEYTGPTPQPGEDITFHVHPPNGQTPDAVEWDFDRDGVIDATGQTATHAYTYKGNYTALAVVRYGDKVVTEKRRVEVAPSQDIFQETGNSISAGGSNDGMWISEDGYWYVLKDSGVVQKIDQSSGSIEASWTVDGPWTNQAPRGLIQNEDGSWYVIEQGAPPHAHKYNESFVHQKSISIPAWYPIGAFSGDGFTDIMQKKDNTTAPAASPGTILWDYQFDESYASNTYFSPSHYDGKVYFINSTGTVTALDATTGDKVWEHDTNADWTQSSPAIENGKVFVTTDAGSTAGVYALDAQTGNRIWEQHFGDYDYSYSAPAVVNGKVILGSSTQKLTALDTQTGDILWNSSTLGDVYGSPVTYSPEEGRVYVVANDHSPSYDEARVFAINPADGSTVWQSSIISAANGHRGVVVTNGTVVVSDWNTGTYGFDADTGSQVWTNSNGNGYTTPTAKDGVVYSTFSSTVFAVNATTGNTLWTKATGVSGYYQEASSTIAGGNLYTASSYDSSFISIDVETQQTNWITPLSTNAARGSPVVVDGVVYVMNEDGKLYAIQTDHTASSSGKRVGQQTKNEIEK